MTPGTFPYPVLSKPITIGMVNINMRNRTVYFTFSVCGREHSGKKKLIADNPKEGKELDSPVCAEFLL